MSSFIDLLSRRFANHPDRPAITYRGETITFGGLERRAKSAACFLQARGLEKGDRVILYTPEKLPFLIVHLGILLSGGMSLPLNPSFTAGEMRYFLDDSEARFAVASGAQGQLLRDLQEHCSALQGVFDPESVVARRSGFRSVDVQPKDHCFMLYSSGTTGQPKGVVHTHENLGFSILDIQRCWRFTPDDVLLNVLPLFHIHGLSFATHMALVSGSHTIIEDTFQPRRTMELIRDVTVFMAVPTMYYAFLRRPEFRTKAREWKNTRLFTCGSAPIRPGVLPELEEILGRHLINRYGMTESHVITSLPLDGPFVQGSVGLPLDGVDFKLEREDGATGAAVGEVRIRGQNLFSHYWKKEDETARSFDKEGYFSTGDLGFLDKNGFLTLVGRKKDLIITGGLNVYPPVVERVINEHPNVAESAVIGVPDEFRGEKVVAVVVPSGDLDTRDLDSFCRERLVDYQRPTEIRIARELPRNTMGKVLKRELKENIHG